MRQSLTRKMNTMVLVIFLAMGGLITFGFMVLGQPIVDELGTSYAVNRVLREKSRVEALVEKEIALALKLADSPIIKKWCTDESDKRIKSLALSELESFKKHFKNHNYFLAMSHSGHYYFNDRANKYDPLRHRYTLHGKVEKDAWFYRMLKEVDDYELNLDINVFLQTVKIWINVIIKNRGEKVGVTGTGLDLTGFLKDVVYQSEEGVDIILLDREGNISAYKNPTYIEANARAKQSGKKIKIFDLLESQEDKERFASHLAALDKGTQQVETFKINVDGKSYLASGVRLANLGWQCFVLIDLPKILDLKTFTPVLGLMLVLLGIAVFLISWFVRREMLMPLSRLSDSAELISQRNYQVDLPEDKNDEIGALSRSFGQMAVQVRQYTENLEDMVEERTKSLTLANQALEFSNQRMTDSINYARIILQGVLPADEYLKAIFPEHVLVWQPKDLVGGDMYFVTRTPSGRIIVVGDCTGHGVPGALMVMSVQALLKRALKTVSPTDPSLVLTELNLLVKKTLNHDPASPVDSGLDIGICYLPDHNDEMIFAGAGMSIYIRENGKVTVIKPDRKGLGYRRSPDNYVFTRHQITGLKGKVFYLASDGILDQPGGKSGLPFGSRRFINFLESLANLPLERQGEAVYKVLLEYSGPREQRDDLVFFGFRA
ncbi:SpoIIE family protein phosphatase [Dethiosulfatarculus sandiegensis]|uniref:HAMP domain-containing protein n=1 Tax=Dethiosulfatarculus sandiegensis TaxID=1429043 RepID=A0A0D2JBE8_9BACT|nr:SpoIIE family protein phosphatase [Dethiosulfatarculus sandiegensis]KIX13046.1 hypothetical protein X474_15895 [Dethiosulfatarculus sandiegensis]